MIFMRRPSARRARWAARCAWARATRSSRRFVDEEGRGVNAARLPRRLPCRSATGTATGEPLRRARAGKGGPPLRRQGRHDTRTEIAELRARRTVYFAAQFTRSSRAGRRTFKPALLRLRPRGGHVPGGPAKRRPRPRRPAKKAGYTVPPPRPRAAVPSARTFKSYASVVMAGGGGRRTGPCTRRVPPAVTASTPCGTARAQEQRPRNGPMPLRPARRRASPRSRLPRMSRTPGSEIDARGGPPRRPRSRRVPQSVIKNALAVLVFPKNTGTSRSSPTQRPARRRRLWRRRRGRRAARARAQRAPLVGAPLPIR